MLEPLRSVLGAKLPGWALDVGCGTGLSSLALSGFAARVVATDVSSEMLRAAAPHPSIHYVAAPAETLPFRPRSFELATVGCAFHWCEPEALLAELDRVLCPGALLLVYDNAFFGEMREQAAAQEWFSCVYQARYPAPPRRAPFRPELASAAFHAVRSEFIDEWIPFTREELVRYLTTQSNVIDAVESGRATLVDVETFLGSALAPLFESAGISRAHFRFGGLVHVLRHGDPTQGGAQP